MSQKRLHIAVYLMVKNEKKRLYVSLESVKNIADSIIIYDTGSTDNTIEIAKQFCIKNNIPLRLLEGSFIDFSKSRNAGLDFAETFSEIDYILLLDTNDELKNYKLLRNFCNEQFKYDDHNGFLLCQQWWSGNLDKYYNVRLIKARKGWRYMGTVHEYITDCRRMPCEIEKPVIRASDDIVIYQDRTQDDDKTGKRFIRDKELLLKSYYENPLNERTVFYLAQTYGCLSQFEECLYFYKLRSNMNGFEEERFHSYLKSGDSLLRINGIWHDAMIYYIKAFEHSKRAEPICKIIEYYVTIQNWELAFMYVSLCCELKFPDHCILFIDKGCYDYNRWHLLGYIGYNMKRLKEGKYGVLKALENKPDSQIDKEILKKINEELNKN